MSDEFYLPSGGSITLGSSPTGSPFLAVESAAIAGIKGMASDDMDLVNALFRVWRDKYPRNLIRSAYYDARERFRDFGISIPDSIKGRAQVPIGWPEKAVRSLADKSRFEGFSIPDGRDGHGIAGMVSANALDVDVSEAIVSAYKHSCAFLTISADPEDPARIAFMPRSADWSAAIWDRRRRRIAAALTITEDDERGRITGFDAWLPGRVYSCAKCLGVWACERLETNYARPTVVPLVFDKQMDRPFGHSRINRVLMNLTDIAFRTIVRMEASAEFYSVPKLWFLGANRDAFSENTWKSLVSAINAINRDEDGNMPELKQVQQASMQPHGDMLETIAMLVSSQSDIPAESLGIRLTNPTSAEALAASENSLTRTANRQNRHFAHQLKDAVAMAVCLHEHLSEPPGDLGEVTPVFAPTKESSDASKADYYAKIASVNPAFADSDIGLMKAGMSLEEIAMLRADERRQRARQRIDQLKTRTLNGRGADDGSEQSAPEPLKAAGAAEAPEPGPQKLSQ